MHYETHSLLGADNYGTPPFSGVWRDVNDYATRNITAKVSRDYWGYASTTMFDNNFDNNPIKGVKSLTNAFYLACVNRLLTKKFIPRSHLEVSKTFTTTEERALGAIFKKYYPEYWQVPFWELEDYFSTLQAMQDSDYGLAEYFFLLTFPDICGVSFKDEYQDPDITPIITKYKLPFQKIYYVNSPAVNPLYKDFWQKYETWALDRFLRDKIASKALRESKIMQNYAGTAFDIDSLGSYIRAIASTLDNDKTLGEGYIDGLVNMQHTINFLAKYPDSISKTAQNWYTLTRSFSQLLGGKYTAKVKEIWKNTILPAKIQLNNMIAQWNRLKTNDPPITQAEKDTLFDITKNVFLMYDEARTEEMGQVIVTNLARSPLIAAQPQHVALPGLQYMFKPVSDISETRVKEFTPLFSYSDPNAPKLPVQQSKKSGSLLPLVIAGAVAAGAYYYSNR